MKYAKPFISLLIIFALLLITPLSAFSIETEPQTLQNSDKNPPNIKKLEWSGPENILPQNFSQYLEKHPYRPASFQLKSQPKLADDGTKIHILVEESIYSAIESTLQTYIQDIQAAGYIATTSTLQGGDPTQVKNWLKEQYQDDYTMFFFIGDIPAAWAEVSGSVFPSDLFYLDLDGEWLDTDNDQVYESHTAGSGDMAPEITIGRLYSSTLYMYGTETELINSYLQKNHQYRIGELNQPWRGLEYIEEDWWDMDVALQNVYSDNVERYDYGFETTAQDYLQKMSLGQHFVQVCVHSWPQGHSFSTHPTEAASYAHVYIYSPTERSSQIHLGCDDGARVYLNSEQIFEIDRIGSWSQDQYTIEANLQEGWNQLLIKISQRNGDYGFSAKITDPTGDSYDDLLYQYDDPTQTGTEAPYIRGWLINGFHQDTSENFWNYLSTNYLGENEADISPEQGDYMGGKTWQLHDTASPLVDLDSYFGGVDFGAAYAYAEITSETLQHCQLWLGYDDGIKAWLNGEQIHLDNRYGGYEADMAKIDVTLQQGTNRLLLKISEWMGSYSFSARFCTNAGNPIEGLTYNPEWQPISHIGTWLLNGAYSNPNQNTRLTTDYLGDEAHIRPTTNQEAPIGVWQRAVSSGTPVNLRELFNTAESVTSDTIQAADPPVLFYNLFSCGPGRFTDDQYLAGSYIFGTTYGLITIASAKSGSMLYFEDFYTPLGEGKSIGESYQDWFTAQAPYALWEQEWYYGMVLNGDPTLTVTPQLNLHIEGIDDAIYLNGQQILPFLAPLIIGDFEFTVNVTGPGEIQKIQLYVDDTLEEELTQEPYTFAYTTPGFLKKTLRIVATTQDESNIQRSIEVWKLF